MAKYPIFFRATGWKVRFFFQIKNELVSKHEILLKRAALQELFFFFLATSFWEKMEKRSAARTERRAPTRRSACSGPSSRARTAPRSTSCRRSTPSPVYSRLHGSFGPGSALPVKIARLKFLQHVLVFPLPVSVTNSKFLKKREY